VGDDIMRDRMVTFLGQSKKLEAGRPDFNPRTQNVTEALDMLKTNIRLVPKCQPPMWLKQGTGEPDAGELLAFGNGLVNVRTGQRLAPTPRLAAEGGGRRPAFTGLAGRPYSCHRV
jgi:hypothetical protein